jgi:UDP-N-acetylmuramate dehydrogenase
METHMSATKNQLFISKVYDIISEDQVLCDEPLKEYTSFKIGGPADYLLFPKTNEEVSRLIKLCREEKIPLFVLGNGSNLLVTDEGFRGAIIQLYRSFNGISIDHNRMTAQAGALLSQVASAAAKASLTGLEFASGIPGTLGGAVFMNAGAYGGEMEQVVRRVTAVDMEGNLYEFTHDELDFSYRHSMLQVQQMVALDVTMELQEGDQTEIRRVMFELNKRRKEKQPLEYPSAGSTFKRPHGYYAGKLIMDSGLAGYRVGDAMVSEKHCGFIINVGSATCSDVLKLIDHIQKVVYDKYQVKLEREVKVIGER